MASARDAPNSAAERVLTSGALFPLIVAFQDGLPGLLRELKREAAEGEHDLAACAVRRGSLRALEMIDSFRQQPSYARRHDLSYDQAARLAVVNGDAALLRWCYDRANAAHRPKYATQLWQTAIRHFKASEFSVLELLTERIGKNKIAAFGKDCWDGVRERALLEWIDAEWNVTLPRRVFADAVRRGDHGFVDFWLARRPEGPPKHILDTALQDDQWAMFLKLVAATSVTQDEEERRELATRAVYGEDLAMLKVLHVKPFTMPPIEALELAAEKGLVEFVEELSYRHKDILTERALQLAASNGHLEVVQFIYRRSDLEGVPGAIDGAAAGGHLAVVRFLHTCKVFTATHEAMNGAAAGGHLSVLQFLHDKRKEGCTPDALVRAAANGRDAAVQWLIANRDEVRSGPGLDGLLLHGRVDEWLVYREEWSLYGTKDVDGVEHLELLMFQAGEQGKLKAVRFLCDVLHCTDSLSRAVEGAARIGSVGWLFALQSVCPSASFSGRLSMAVTRAFEALDDVWSFQPSDQERLDAIKWLLLQSGGRTDAVYAMAMQIAATKAEESRQYHTETICRELLLWMDTRHDDAAELERLRDQYVTDAFRFAQFGSACDWVVELSVAWALTHKREEYGDSEPFGQYEERDEKWLLGNKTWPKRAIERNDMAVLYYSHIISTSYALQDEEVASFRFDDSVLTATIAAGNLAMVQWCVSTCFGGQLDDPCLLADAVKYAQPNVAEWLLANYPNCCTEHSVDRFDVWDSCAAPEIFDWLDRLETTHPELVRHRQPVYIAYSLAHGGHVALLERWVQTHPEILDKIGDVLFYAAAGEQFAAVEVVCQLIDRCQRGNAAPHGLVLDEYQVQRAMAIAASKGRLRIVEFLFAKFPTILWHYAVRDAAIYGHVRVLRFFFTNGYDSWADYQEIQELKKPAHVRRLAFLCRTRGIRKI